MEEQDLKQILSEHSLYLSSKGTEGKKADLYGADLYRADLAGADLQGAALYRADLAGADLQGANLAGANLRRANLYGADLDGANLRGADLDGANLEEANLPEKKLVVGNLYSLQNSWIGFREKVFVCLLSKNEDNSLNFIEAVLGQLHKNQPNWLKYSFEEVPNP